MNKINLLKKIFKEIKCVIVGLFMMIIIFLIGVGLMMLGSSEYSWILAIIILGVFGWVIGHSYFENKDKKKGKERDLL